MDMVVFHLNELKVIILNHYILNQVNKKENKDTDQYQ